MEDFIRNVFIIREIIKDDNLDIIFSNVPQPHIEFTIFDSSFKTDCKTFFDVTIEDETQKINISNVTKLYNYIMVTVMRKVGVNRHKSLVTPFNELDGLEQNHIKRLSNYELVGVDFKTIYENITFTVGSPKDVSDILNVSENLIKNIRVKNRKRLISYAVQMGQMKFI